MVKCKHVAYLNVLSVLTVCAIAAAANELENAEVFLRKPVIQFDDTERLSSYNSMLEAVDTSGGGGGGGEIGPISFIISKVDMTGGPATAASTNTDSLSTIPIIMPASAQLNEPEEDTIISSKRKKNFSKLAKTIILASKKLLRRKNITEPVEEEGEAEEEIASTTTEAPTTTTTTIAFDVNTYCEFKDDDTYPDPSDCQNFVICYGGKAFKTACAAGTLYNHAHKDCDFETKGKTITTLKNLYSIHCTLCYSSLLS
jgi:hypothetical protein